MYYSTEYRILQAKNAVCIDTFPLHLAYYRHYCKHWRTFSPNATKPPPPLRSPTQRRQPLKHFILWGLKASVLQQAHQQDDLPL